MIVSGDYVIGRTSYGSYDEARKVERVAKSYYWYTTARYERVTRANIAGVVFVGDEDSVSKLLEKLVSSDALCRDEMRNSRVRQIKRDEELVACASMESGQ